MRASRWLLPLGVVAIVSSLLALIVLVAGVEARIVEDVWNVDPETGFIIPHLSSGQQRHPFSIRYEHWVWPIIAAVLAFTALLAFTLHRIDRERRLGLAYVVLPLALPLLIGLATATLVHDLYQDWFGELVYGLFSSESLDTCHGLLSPCSHMLGFDELRNLAASLIVAATLIALVPSARAAWRAGQHGARLGKGWSGAALVCFVAGAVALLWTRAHREDRAQLLAECARGRATHADWCEQTSLFDVSPNELQGVDIEGCDPTSEFEVFDWSSDTDFQLFATGEISELSRPGRESELLDSAALREQLERSASRTLIGDAAAVTVFVDERTPLPTLAEILRDMDDVGIEVVLLLGSHTLSGEFATLGPWRRRVHCRLGFLRLDARGHGLDEFEGFTEVAIAASAEGRAGLRVNPREPLTRGRATTPLGQ